MPASWTYGSKNSAVMSYQAKSSAPSWSYRSQSLVAFLYGVAGTIYGQFRYGTSGTQWTNESKQG